MSGAAMDKVGFRPAGVPTPDSNQQRLEAIRDAIPRFHLSTLRRNRSPNTQALIQILENAAYWQAFHLAHFEPMLVHAPQLMSDFGIGCLLAFGDAPSGLLDLSVIRRAEAVFFDLPREMYQPLVQCLYGLERALLAKRAENPKTPLREVKPSFGRPAMSLRAFGKVYFEAIDGMNISDEQRVEVSVGEPFTLKIVDERGRAVRNFSFENDRDAPLLVGQPNERGLVQFLANVPGVYRLLVHGKLGQLAVYVL